MKINILKKEEILEKGINELELMMDFDTYRLLEPGSTEKGFTGLAYNLWKDEILSDYSYYEYGKKCGPMVVFYNNEMVKYYQTMYYGIISGPYRKWNEQGRLVVEEMYELGILLQSKKWDEDGNLVEEKKEITEEEKKELEQKRMRAKESMERFMKWKEEKGY